MQPDTIGAELTFRGLKHDKAARLWISGTEESSAASISRSSNFGRKRMSETIFITGTSSGIGKAATKLFQSRGWNVVATMREPAKEEELKKLENILVTKLDVTDPDSIRAAVSAGCELFGQIDVLLNNAGFGVYGPLEASSLETIRRQFD